MKKKELEQKINDIEKRLDLFVELVSNRELKHSRIFTNHIAEELKRNKETNRKVDKLKEAVEVLLLKEISRTINHISDLLGKEPEKKENCKKCVEKPAKKCKKCEKTEKTAPKTENMGEIKAGDIVKIIKSESDHIEEIKNMIGKEYKVRRTGQNPDGTISYYIPDKENSISWAFSREEIELVENRRGRGRPVGSKNKNKETK